MNEHKPVQHRLIIGAGCGRTQGLQKVTSGEHDGNVQPGCSQSEETPSGNKVETPTPSAGAVLLYRVKGTAIVTGTTLYARVYGE